MKKQKEDANTDQLCKIERAKTMRRNEIKRHQSESKKAWKTARQSQAQVGVSCKEAFPILSLAAEF